MRQPTLTDYIFLAVLALIWASAFFNIKIATYSYGPVTIAFLRILLGAIPVIGLCLFKKIKIEAFSKDWYWFASRSESWFLGTNKWYTNSSVCYR